MGKPKQGCAKRTRGRPETAIVARRSGDEIPMPDAPPKSDLLDLSPAPVLPRDRSVGIGCIGAGFIMADCHLVAYRRAELNPVAISARRRESAQEVADR